MTFTEILIVIQTVVLVGAPPAVVFYGKEKLKNLLREEADRRLADYRHEHEKQLEEIRADNSRQSEQFSLYERERHRAYARVFRRYRIAADLSSRLVAPYGIPDFATFREADLSAYLKNHRVWEQVAAPARDAFQQGLTALFVARMTEIDDRIQIQRAERAYQAARNAEALEELYLSDQVRLQLDDVRRAMSRYMVKVRRDINDPDDATLYKRDELATAITRLYALMRDELRSQ